jgi:hypothetical protein
MALSLPALSQSNASKGHFDAKGLRMKFVSLFLHEISKTDGKWHCSGIDFFLPVKALSKIFKAKFRDIIKNAGLYPQINSDVWNQNWVVNCQPIGAGEHSIKYLAPYVFKVAISNNRIVKYRRSKSLFQIPITFSNKSVLFSDSNTLHRLFP